MLKSKEIVILFSNNNNFPPKMAFISSKLVQEIETVFQHIQTPHLIKCGEAELNKLREKTEFSLALANFIARSNNHHDRTLAVLELKKKLRINDSQTVLLLKNVYYQDIDRIAMIIRQIFTHQDNLQWTNLLLISNFDQFGTLQTFRLIELIFSLLKQHQNTRNFLEDNFGIFLDCYLELINLVVDNQDLLFMMTTTLSMFYQEAMRIHEAANIQKIRDHWRIIRQKCKFYNTPKINTLTTSIENFIFNRSQEVSSQNVHDLISSILFSDTTHNELRVRYQSQCLRFIFSHSNCLRNSRAILQFIRSFNDYATEKNMNILVQSSLKCPTEFNNFLQAELDSKQEKIIKEILNKLAEQIFQQHYQSIVQQYSQSDNPEKPLFVYLLPIINHYSSSSSPVDNWAEDHIEHVVNYIGSYLTSLQFQQQSKQKIIIDFINCLEFLIKFKSQISLHLLPHAATIIQQISALKSTLTSLCYLFLDQIWEELCQLDFCQLTSFLVKHIRHLNGNEWDHNLQNFSCFLNIALHLEEHFQFYSNLLLTDSLVQQSISAQQIMTELLTTISDQNYNSDLFSKLIAFSGYLVNGAGPDKISELHSRLKISYLALLIDKHQLYTPESAKIVAIDWSQTHRLIPSFQSYSQTLGKEIEDDFYVMVKREMKGIKRTRNINEGGPLKS